MANYCGHCGKRGHNRRTCPYRSDEAKEFDKACMRKSGRRKGSTTQCSYCGGIGHNRRTCQLLKSDKAWVVKQSEVVVRSTLENLSLIGCGVGFLQRTSRWGEEYLGIHSGEIRSDFRYSKTCSESDRQMADFGERRYMPLVEISFRLDSRDITNSRNGTPDICFEGSYSNIHGLNNGSGQLLKTLDNTARNQYGSCVVSESRIPHTEKMILEVLERLGKRIEKHFSSRDNVSPFHGAAADPERIAKNNTYEIFDES